MQSVFETKEECCGCTACQSICPVDAIKMVKDEEGFLYPEISELLCIDCMRCKNVCSFQNGYDTSENFDVPLVFAAKNKDEKIRLESSSGGASSAIEDSIFDSGGAVFGAGLNENLELVHSLAETHTEAKKFRGSKYVQSDLKNTFVTIKELLTQGRSVLFTGTPCQTSGLKSYIGNQNRENLLLCDLVCHGTPSPLLWNEHIKSLGKRKKSKVTSYAFRHKIFGWHTHTEMVSFENGESDCKSAFSQKHKELFYANLILRPACHSCPYTNVRRPSDITLADFWGIENSLSSFDDNKGVSLILVNTNKGKIAFDRAATKIECINSDLQSCMQGQMKKPAPRSKYREQFWKEYFEHGYAYVARKYVLKFHSLKRVKRKMQAVIGSLLRKKT